MRVTPAPSSTNTKHACTCVGTPSRRIHCGYAVGLGHIQLVGRGTGPIATKTPPVGNGYCEAFDQFFSRWK